MNNNSFEIIGLWISDLSFRRYIFPFIALPGRLSGIRLGSPLSEGYVSGYRVSPIWPSWRPITKKLEVMGLDECNLRNALASRLLSRKFVELVSSILA